MAERLLVIDGNAVVYQSYYAFARQGLTSPDGVPVGAIYGFIRKIISLLKKYPLTHIVVAFDSRGKTDNHLLFEDYKANRKPMPDDLVPQLDAIMGFLAAADISVIKKTGHEADDIIGTICERMKKRADIEIFIYTPDKDLLQLIDKNVTVIRSGPRDDVILTPSRFLEEYGFSHEYMPDFLAITGDAADNVPGVSGVGKVGARKLIQSMGAVDNIIRGAESIKNLRVREAVLRDAEQLMMSYRLVTINRDVPVEFDFQDWRYPSYDINTLRRFLTMYGLESLKKDFSDRAPREHLPLTPLTADLKGSFLTAEFDGDIQVCDLESATYHSADSLEGLYGGAGNTVWVYDAHSLRRARPDISCRLMDVRLLEYWGEDSDSSGDFKKFAVRREIRNIRELHEYFLKTADRLRSRGQWEEVYTSDHGFSGLLLKMEKKGVKIDDTLLEEYRRELIGSIASLEKDIYSLAGIEFNINSPKQLGEVLFEKMGVKPEGRIRKGKTGFSTDENVLRRVREVHPIGAEILNYRKLHKIYSTYVMPYIELMDSDCRVHSDFDYCGTATGRLTSRNPNLQNIPVHGDWGERMRRLIIAPAGHILMAADYSQMELRILAHFSGDSTLSEVFRNNGDIHAETALRVFGRADSDWRRRAKTINFGIMYGQSSYSLASQLGISVTEAEDYISRYFKRFSAVRDYIEASLEQARQNGWVQVLSGRRRAVPGIKSKNRNIREAAERIAVNTPIQGSAADIIKAVMLRLDKAYTGNTEVSMVLQIHDELLFEIEDDAAAESAKQIKAIMEDVPYGLSVPMSVETGMGRNWGEAH